MSVCCNTSAHLTTSFRVEVQEIVLVLVDAQEYHTTFHTFYPTATVATFIFASLPKLFDTIGIKWNIRRTGHFLVLAWIRYSEMRKSSLSTPPM